MFRAWLSKQWCGCFTPTWRDLLARSKCEFCTAPDRSLARTIVRGLKMHPLYDKATGRSRYDSWTADELNAWLKEEQHRRWAKQCPPRPAHIRGNGFFRTVDEQMEATRAFLRR